MNFAFDYLIVGGQYTAIKRDFIMSEFSSASFVSFGDADVSLIPLLRCILFGNKDYSQIPALCYRRNKRLLQIHLRNAISSHLSCQNLKRVTI